MVTSVFHTEPISPAGEKPFETVLVSCCRAPVLLTSARTDRYMLGRGVKRKLSDYEESMAAGIPGVSDSGFTLPYLQQRQLVLDMCLSKLQSCHRKVEPSLHRSVLLANTLRQIQEEMRQEGGDPPLTPQCGEGVCSPATPMHTPDLPPVPPESPGGGSVTDGGAAPPAPSLPPEAASEPLACPRCAGSEEGMCFAPSPGPPPFAAEGDARSPDSLFSCFEITNSTSYLTDLALDDIFEDIDTSMYDSSDFSSVLAFPASSAEDGLKSFPTCNSPSASGIQICITDLNDLDHIMEILVGS
ncbi:cell division cycle-associated protein 4 isoform X1 [Lepisosteus oculatus]|uniref:cell division cycle-associated protein 4 isoform X1 n=2 Tax=Lepisosteus oculatus TaxID=7918 RepID=UPI00371BCA12